MEKNPDITRPLARRYIKVPLSYAVFMFFVRGLKLLTDADAVCGRPKLKVIVERFWNGSVRELENKTFRVNLKCYESESNYSQALIPRT